MAAWSLKQQVAAQQAGGPLLTVTATTGAACSLSAMVCAAGTTRARLRDMYTEHGDLGDVAQACRQTQVRLSSTGHTLLQVYPGRQSNALTGAVSELLCVLAT